jgi:hypothetical protein
MKTQTQVEVEFHIEMRVRPLWLHNICLPADKIPALTDRAWRMASLSWYHFVHSYFQNNWKMQDQRAAPELPQSYPRFAPELPQTSPRIASEWPQSCLTAAPKFSQSYSRVVPELLRAAPELPQGCWFHACVLILRITSPYVRQK